MGRPPKTLTDEDIIKVEALAAYLSQDQISDYLGVARTTFAAMMERDPNIAMRYKKGKARAIATVAKGLLQAAIEGDGASRMFYLKTQAGWRETDRLEHSGSIKHEGEIGITGEVQHVVIYLPENHRQGPDGKTKA